MKKIVGSREELSQFVGQTIRAKAFVSNTVRYGGDRRLLQEVKLKDFYIGHLWVKEEHCPTKQVRDGYYNIKVKVVSYTDKRSGEKKYGIVLKAILDKKGKERRFKKPQLVKPKWMKDED